MERQEIFEKVTQLMADLFDLDKASITPESRFEDLQLTSLDAIDLVVELQRLTGRKVAEQGLRSVRTVGDVVALVQAHLAEGEKV
jgi:acyl carrier protein